MEEPEPIVVVAPTPVAKKGSTEGARLGALLGRGRAEDVQVETPTEAAATPRRDEVAEYLALDSVPFGTDVLQWWKAHAESFPHLAA